MKDLLKWCLRFFRIDWLKVRMSFEGPPGMGFEILLRIDWLMAGMSFEDPPGISFEIFLRMDWLMA